MIIHAHILAFNEEKILPFVLDYYSNICEKIFVYDNMSTDSSDEIYARYSKVTVIKWSSDNSFNDFYNKEIKSTSYKLHSRDADWVIVCDCDEILYHPNLINMLKYYKKIGVDIPEIDGRDMVSETFPEYDGRLITDIVQIGSNTYDAMCKNIIFNPKKDVVFGYGAHQSHCENCVRSQERELKLLHYKFLGKDYVIKMYDDRLARLSEFNIKHGFGVHYNNPPIDYMDKLIKENRNVILE
jgi:hypothetical protein